MKFRLGFVSNSSNTSFCIYGIYVDKMPDKIREILENSGELEIISDQSGDGYYVGKSWAEVGDNETGRQFKDSVEKIIRELFAPDTTCQTHEDGWYDG